jgi:hypothetical protein
MDVGAVTYYKSCLVEFAKEAQRRSGNGRLNFRDDKLDEVFCHYNEYERRIKGLMPQGDALDQHKQSAALCCATLKAWLLEPVSVSPPVLDNPYVNNANELCAYLMGIQMMQDVWMSRAINTGLPQQEMQIYNNKITVPSLHSSVNATYVDWFMKLLKKDLVKGVPVNYFDYEDPRFDIKRVFFLSHIYYLIECYSYQYYRAEIAVHNGSQPVAQAVTGVVV